MILPQGKFPPDGQRYVSESGQGPTATNFRLFSSIHNREGQDMICQ